MDGGLNNNIDDHNDANDVINGHVNNKNNIGLEERQMFFQPTTPQHHHQLDMENFPILLKSDPTIPGKSNNAAKNSHHALFIKPETRWERVTGQLGYVLMKLSDKHESNVYQVWLVSFLFYFYNGLIALPSIDIIKREMGDKNVLFYTSLLFFISGTFCFISSTVLGTLSDKMGRKPFLIISAVVLLIPLTFMLFKKYMFALYLNAFSYILMVGPTIAYIATSDVTPVNKRDRGVALVSVASPLAAILGPLTSMLLYQEPFENDVFSLTTLTLFMIALVMFLLFYVIYIVPESLSEDIRNKAQIDFKKLNPFSNLIDSLCDTRLFLILFICILITIPQEALMSTYFVFLKSYLQMPNWMCVFLIAEFGLAGSFSLAFLMEKMISLLTHRGLLFISITIALISFVIASLKTNIVILALNAFLLSFSYIAYPTIVAYSSQYSDPSLQGAVLGAITGIRQFVYAIVPMMVWCLNKLTHVNFGDPVDPSAWFIAPSFLIIGLLNAVALPFLFYLAPLDLV